MDKIKKFLKDNKGCPITVPAIKQLLVKFIELISKDGVVTYEVSDIKAMTKDQLDALKPGDVVQKITGNQKHTYIVSYKGEGSGEGICLTYCDAGYIETVSYDRTASGWVYNSTDVIHLDEASLKVGYYILNEGSTKIVWVEELPEDYTGIAYYIGNDGISLIHVDNGVESDNIFISTSGINVYSSGENSNISGEGVSKLNFAQLTHSFNELDPTLKALVESAIADDANDGVACSEAQWSAIKELLDKSLYLNYNGMSMIKSFFNGINTYFFGLHIPNYTGYSLDIFFEPIPSKLFIKLTEI